MSRESLTLLALWVHVPLVTAWVGLVLFDVLVAWMPGLPPAQRGRMIAWSRWVSAIAIAVIIATGVWQTMNNPFQQVTSWEGLNQLREKPYGQALLLKHIFVIATLILTTIVRFGLAPRLAVAGQGAAATAARVPTERVILWLSVANLAACLGALTMATRMIWALH